ncbi:hypothetical protein HYH03_017564 [Edaphochlamys debaryana]|uniref:Uncharacterized protein n=1 Tax=Edaphochlamys debaryana TaxID=47281 RepID=A0A835XFE5_9CHLO|nr:hypothetical protein HYH03_017564 [Edaphochlamys debaryana]|eukprot:KAG2483557.1 hypothetical protein HYH03_017564 [Edaphochlamys debaryana]
MDGNTAKKPKLAAAATKPSLEEMFASATAKGLDLNEVLDMFKCTRKVYLTRKYNDGNALVTENQFAADPAACAEAAGAEVEAAAEPVAEPEADEADPGSDGGDFGFAEEAEPRCSEKAVRVACFISNKKLLEKYIIWRSEARTTDTRPDGAP